MILMATDPGPAGDLAPRDGAQAAPVALHREDLATGHDAANRAAVKQVAPEALNIVGLALREDRKLVDKVTKVSRMHP